MKLSHVTETIPTPDEAADRVTQYLKSRKHLTAAPASIQHNSGNNKWHREQDRLEQRQNDERATANEDMSDTPNPGDNIRTNRTDMEGKVERVDQNVVFFRLADGRLMKTSTNNVTVVEKLADEEGEIMEKKDSLNLSNKITDPGLLADIEFADSHYPGSSNGLEALLKLFSRGHHHSEKNDKVHDEQLAKIQHDMDAVKRVASEHPQLREVDKKYGAEIEQLKQEIIALKRGSIEQQRVSQGGTGRRVADMQSIEESELREISDTVINKWQREKLGPQMVAAKARGDTGEENRVYGKIIKSTKHMGDNFERRAAQQAAQEKQGVAEGSAHGYNVVRYYEKTSDQKKLTNWLRKEAGLEKDAPVYFDDADLVYGDKTIVPNALVNPKLKFNDLLTALTQATGGQGKQKVDGVYREQGVAEGTLKESDKFTSWYDWKDQAKSSGYTITRKDDRIVALNKQGQVVGHWSDIGKFLSGKAPRPNFKRPVEQGVAEDISQLNEFAPNNNDGGGKWYNDEDLAAILGEGWWDLPIDGYAEGMGWEEATPAMVKIANDWLEEHGYTSVIEACRRSDDEETMDWFLASPIYKNGLAEDQLNELDRQTVINYVPARINSAKALARTDYDKAKRVTQQDIPRALTKLRDKNYGRTKKGDVEENEEINNHTDTITVDVPLLIRIMEYAKEDAKTDLDLHNAAEKLIELSQEGRTLTMDDYATMIGDVNEGGMGGINRSAPSNDVSYQDVLDNSTDEWRGDTVKVEESTFYSERLKAFLKDID